MIGDNIKRLLQENNYTQKELAMRAECTQHPYQATSTTSKDLE
jgi:transcriptional regulator with XRE-family HTH domain